MNKPIDVLINSAAVNVSKPVFYMEYEDVENSFKVNNRRDCLWFHER